MRISSITKNAGKACNNRLYRHIRTFEKIVKNYFVIYLKDDIEEKWVVVPDGVTFSKEEIRRQIHFQEQYFDSEIVM